MKTTIIAECEYPERLDSYLARELEDISRSKIKAWCKSGEVLVNGEIRKSSFHLQGGEEIVIDAKEEPELDHILPEDLPLDIVYEDQAIVILNKAAGMVVHPGAGVSSGTLVNALVFHFGSLSTTGGLIRPGIVHRLDKGTTGIMVVAKTDLAHQRLSEQWQEGKVTKVYQTLVWGIPDPPDGEIESNIGRHPRFRHRMTADAVGGKWAKSRYKTIGTFPEAARLNVQILTGRTHQVRVHLAHLGHPVVGDAMYGGNRHQNLAKSFDAMPEVPMLHAALLRFDHPISGEEMTFKAPLPEIFQKCEYALSLWKK